MFLKFFRRKRETKKQKICQTCETGRKMYELDNRSPMCPYIAMVKNGKCAMYKNAEK